MSSIIENPRAVIGDNRSTTAFEEVTARLGSDYAEQTRRASHLVETAENLAPEIRDESMLKAFANVDVAMRDVIARLEATRIAEKDPYFRAAQAVDGFFKTVMERLERSKKTVKSRIDAYKNRLLAEERERRRLEAERQAREAAEARAREERARREAEEKRAAAERARSRKEIKDAEAVVAEDKAAEASAAASTAYSAAEKARIDALRPPKEIARERFEDGTVVTMRQVGFAELINRDLVDRAALWPYLTDKEIEKALRAWAKANGYAKPMGGALVGLKEEAVVLGGGLDD